MIDPEEFEFGDDPYFLGDRFEDFYPPAEPGYVPPAPGNGVDAPEGFGCSVLPVKSGESSVQPGEISAKPAESAEMLEPGAIKEEGDPNAPLLPPFNEARAAADGFVPAPVVKAMGPGDPIPPFVPLPSPAPGDGVPQSPVGPVFNPRNCNTPEEILIQSGALERYQENRRLEAEKAAAALPPPGGPPSSADAASGSPCPAGACPDAVPGANAAFLESQRARAGLPDVTDGLEDLLPKVPAADDAKIRATLPRGQRRMSHAMVAVGALPDPIPEKDNKAALFKNGWLRKGGGAIFIAPSGVGKSTSTMQAAFMWALGKPFFGITPVRPLKILIIQAEDDREEIAFFRNCIKRGLIDEFEVTEEEITACLGTKDDSKDARVFMYKMIGKIGQAFVDEVGAILDERPDIDLLIVNPFQSYFGADVSKNVDLSTFFRVWLDPEIKDPGDDGKDRAAVMFVHHTNKPPAKDDKRCGWGCDMFAAYIGAGGAEMVNWARAVLSLMPTMVPGLFRLIAGKRGARLEWVDINKDPTYTQMIKHADEGRVYWRKTGEADLAKLAECEALGKGRKPGKGGAVGGDGGGGKPPKPRMAEKCSVWEVTNFVSSHDGQTENELCKNAADLMGVDPATVRRRLASLVSEKYGYLKVEKGPKSNSYAVTAAGKKFLEEQANF